MVQLSVFEAFVNEERMSVEQVENIQTKEEFADFIESFRKELVHAPDEWENSDLERFLGAMEAWVRAIDMYAKILVIRPLLVLVGALLQKYCVRQKFMNS